MPHNVNLKMEIKVATLNLCLGLQNKKNLIKETILNEKINLLCMQESEINKNLDHSLLSFPGFNIETENNTSVSRVAVYVDTRINYVRRGDLEGFDSNLMVMDLMGPNQVRIINVYRSFSPQHYTNQRDKFLYQLQLIKLITLK